MRTRRRGLFIILLYLCTFAAFGQQNWQGNAAVARNGEFGGSGLYVASNAFPVDTDILVKNVQTGQSVQVTVVQRIDGAGNIFLLLSNEAGKKLGLTGSQVIRVQANVVSPRSGDLSESLRDEVYSSDPDINPSLSVADEQLLPGPEAASSAQVQPEEAVEIAQAAAADQEAPESEIEENGAAAEEPEAEARPATEPELASPPATEPTPEEKRLQELADRIPQKQLYMPPRQQEVYALSPAEEAVEEPPAEETAEALEEPPVEEVLEVIQEEVTEVEAAVEEPPEEVAAAEEVIEEGPPRVSMPGPAVEEQPLEVALPGPETTEPEKPSPEGTRLPVPEEESPLTMAPEEPSTSDIEEAAAEEPEAEVAVAEQAEAATGAETRVVLSELLPSKSYFLQLGAYSTRSLAEKLAGDLTQNYSVTILPASSGGRQFFKVLVGPLNVDESGTLLYQFRSRGFKDAFLQYVE